MINRSYNYDHEGHLHHFSQKELASLKKAFRDVNKHEDIRLILKNLSDPTKLSLYLLFHKVDQISVNDMCRVLRLNQSAVSHALSDLKKLGLVECRRCGQLMCYSLKKLPKKLAALLSNYTKMFT